MQNLSRRGFVQSSAAMLAAATPVAAQAQQVAGDPPLPAIDNEAQLEALLPQLSNWGRWGADDQIGTLNFITDETRRAAAQLVRTGRAVPLARQISLQTTPGLRGVTYKMTHYDDPLPEESGCFDNVGMVWHGFGHTHLDALCHIFTPEGKQGMYNGYPIAEVTEQGARKLSIEHAAAHGIAGRGVLLDIAALKGGPLPLGTAIVRADLEAAERAGNVRVGEGDIMFVRNGAGPANVLKNGSGLHANCLPWLRERKIAILSNDSDGDIHPPPPGFARWTEPMHMVGIPYLGLSLLDNVDLEGLSATCRELGRWSFFVAASPWRIEGTTSSPMNPLAIF